VTASAGEWCHRQETTKRTVAEAIVPRRCRAPVRTPVARERPATRSREPPGSDCRSGPRDKHTNKKEHGARSYSERPADPAEAGRVYRIRDGRGSEAVVAREPRKKHGGQDKDNRRPSEDGRGEGADAGGTREGKDPEASATELDASEAWFAREPPLRSPYG